MVRDDAGVGGSGGGGISNNLVSGGSMQQQSSWSFGAGLGGGQDDMGSPRGMAVNGNAGAGYSSLHTHTPSARLREIQVLKQRCSQLSADNSYLDNEKNRLESCLEAYKGGEREREQRLMEYKAQLEGMSNQLAYETKRASKANQLEIELNKVKQDALLNSNGNGNGSDPNDPPPPPPSSKEDKGLKLKAALASMNSQVEAYIEEIDEISQSFDEIQRHNTKLLDQLSEQSNAQVKLREQLLKQQKDLRSCRSDMEDRDRAHKEEKDLQRVKEQELQEIEKKFNLLELKKQSLERTLQEKDQKQRDLEAREMQLQQRVNSLQSEMEAKEQEAIASSKKRKLESDTTDTKKDSSSKDSRALKTLQSQCDFYKKFVLCPICKTNHKSDIITRCLHMFCNECIKKSLDSRNRKCPTCGLKFQASDLQKVYF
jgi:DNA repair exonuclease SbcCD ATPase subunit